MTNYVMEQDSRNINNPNHAPMLEAPVLASVGTVLALLLSLILFKK